MRALALLALLAPSLASAERGPYFAAGLDYTVAHGGRVGELDLGYRLEPGLFVRVGRIHATLSIPWHPNIESSNVERDTEEMIGVGVGARVAYRAPLFGGTLAVGAGMTRRWAYGEEAVMRTCGQTRECVAGTYFEKPTYRAWAPQLRIGIGRDKLLPSMVIAGTFEVIVEAIAFNDVPPDGIRDVVISGAFTFTIGGGPRRKPQSRPQPLVGQNL